MDIWEVELGAKAPRTRDTYLYYFKLFCERWGLGPDELYDMRLEDLRAPDPRDHKRIEGMVKTLMAEMGRGSSGKRPRAPSTCASIMRAMSSFFDAQDLELRFKSRDVPRGQANGQRIIMGDQIRELHDMAGRALGYKLRNRGLMMFQKDAGIRISDTALMDIEDYEDAITKFNEAGEPFKEFSPRITKKTKTIAYIHIGPEAIQAIDDYLAERKGKGEILSPGRPLFLKGKHMGRPMKRVIVPGDEDRLSSIALTQIFRRMAGGLGKDGRKISAHSFRKFHQTMCEASMPKNWVAKLQGKIIKDSTGPYSHPEDLPGELMQSYMGAYHRLRVFEDHTIRAEIESQSKQIKNLESELWQKDRGIKVLTDSVEALVGSIELLSRRIEKIEKETTD